MNPGTNDKLLVSSARFGHSLILNTLEATQGAVQKPVKPSSQVQEWHIDLVKMQGKVVRPPLGSIFGMTEVFKIPFGTSL